jgi:hypothetical protein
MYPVYVTAKKFLGNQTMEALASGLNYSGLFHQLLASWHSIISLRPFLRFENLICLTIIYEVWEGCGPETQHNILFRYKRGIDG